MEQAQAPNVNELLQKLVEDMFQLERDDAPDSDYKAILPVAFSGPLKPQEKYYDRAIYAVGFMHYTLRARGARVNQP